MNARAERDSKLAALRQLKAKGTSAQTEGEPSNSSLSLPKNPLATKPEAWQEPQITKDLPDQPNPEPPKPDAIKPDIPKSVTPFKPPVPPIKQYVPPPMPKKVVQAVQSPFGKVPVRPVVKVPEPVAEAEVIEKKVDTTEKDPEINQDAEVKLTDIEDLDKEMDLNPKDQDFTEKIDKVESEEFENLKEEPLLKQNDFCESSKNQETEEPECDDLDKIKITFLKQKLEFLEKYETNLSKTTEQLKEENFKLQEEKENFDLFIENMKKNSERLLKNLENEYERVQSKIRKYEGPKETNNRVSKEIEDLSNDLDFYLMQNDEKEEEIERLKDAIQRSTEELKDLQSLINDGTFLSQPEPPPPGYSQVIDSQIPKRLLSDMGSTGTWNSKKKKP